MIELTDIYKSNGGKVILNYFIYSFLLLLLLSCFSRVRLCVTPETAGSPVPGILQARTLEWAAIYGVAQSQTRLKRLSSSSSPYSEPLQRSNTP